MNPHVPPPAASLDWAYFLDVDGTLIDIAESPDAVIIDASLLDLIARLHKQSGGAMALVSGRAISDLEQLLASLRLPLAGQHGLERRDATGRLWIHAASPEAKCAIKEALIPVLTQHSGLLLEDKGLTMALHYRRAPQLAYYVQRLLERLAHDANAGLEVQHGNCVAEIKPSAIDKGTAVAEYLGEMPFKDRRAVFIGDDLTDEHGFAEVNRLDGISIKVGKGPSCARYRLPDVAAVRRWLGEALKENT